MHDLATLQLWLADAIAARHALLTGKRTASVSYDGKSVSYSQLDIGRLEAYIASLRSQIAALTGQQRLRGPMHLTF